MHQYRQPASSIRGGARMLSAGLLGLHGRHAVAPPLVAPCSASKKSFSSFEDMLAGSDLPLLVDFYATWCGPCQMLSPILSAVSKRMEGKLQVVKIDSDKYPALSSKYKVAALPTLILFRDGQPIDRIEGMLNEQQLVDRMNYFLTVKPSQKQDPSPAV